MESDQKNNQINCNLFTYGSLMFDSVMYAVVKAKYLKQKAVIHGFKRRAVKDRQYPGIIKDSNENVQGVLWLNINEDDLKRLDYFEGSQYTRQSVKTTLENGTIMDGFVYVFNDQERLQDKLWDVQYFSKQHKETFGFAHLSSK